MPITSKDLYDHLKDEVVDAVKSQKEGILVTRAIVLTTDDNSVRLILRDRQNENPVEARLVIKNSRPLSGPKENMKNVVETHKDKISIRIDHGSTQVLSSVEPISVSIIRDADGEIQIETPDINWRWIANALAKRAITLFSREAQSNHALSL